MRQLLSCGPRERAPSRVAISCVFFYTVERSASKKGWAQEWPLEDSYGSLLGVSDISPFVLLKCLMFRRLDKIPRWAIYPDKIFPSSSSRVSFFSLISFAACFGGASCDIFLFHLLALGGLGGGFSPVTAEASPAVEDQATAAQRAKQEAHNDRIVATFNSVSL